MLRVWDAAVARPTRDIDFLGRIENRPEAVRAAVLECLSADVPDDGLRFSDSIDVAQAMVDDRYPGLRVKLRGDLAGARFMLRLDIGIDDAVVPAPGWVDYPPMLEQPAPRILAYEPATAVAEKFECPTLVSALTATFVARSTELPSELPVALTVTFSEQAGTAAMWQAYRLRLAASAIQAPSDLAGVLVEIAAFVMPPARAASKGARFVQFWRPGIGWSPRSTPV